MGAVPIADVEGVALAAGVGFSLSKGVAGFEVEGNLALADIEDIAEGGTGELIVGVGGVTAAIEEIDAIAVGGWGEINGTAAGDDDIAGQTAGSDRGCDGGTILSTGDFRSVGM